MAGINRRNTTNAMMPPLSHITVVTTQRCNLSCKGCYIDINSGNDLDINEFDRKILLPFTVLGGKSIGFSGGEPLLYEGLYDAIRLAKQYCLFVSLVTNGVLFDRSTAKTLAELGVNSLQISLDSSDNAYNDDIRGYGNKNMVARAIKNAVSVGLSPSLVAVPNQSLLGELENYIKEARQLNVSRIYLRRSIKKLNAKSFEEERMFNKTFLIKVKEMQTKYPDIGIISGDPLFNTLRFEGQFDNTIPLFSGCSAGISSLAIWPNGIVTPCTRLSVPIGNVNDEGLEKIWLENKILLNLRSRELKGECGQCAFRYVCGGCRASSFIDTDDVYASDPLCFIK